MLFDGFVSEHHLALKLLTCHIYFAGAKVHQNPSKMFMVFMKDVKSAWFQSHLVLLDFILGRVLCLAFPPDFLQVCMRTLQRVLLQLVLRLITLEGGLWTNGGH